MQAPFLEHHARPEHRPPSVAFGPMLEGWGSWQWVGGDLQEELAQHFDTRSFESIPPESDVVIVVKHPLPPDLARTVAERSVLIYCPIDHYGSSAQIDADDAMLRCCSRIVVHCDRLRRYFEPYAPVDVLDHHAKFVLPRPAPHRLDGPILWVGVRSNLPPLTDWLQRNTLDENLWVLTNFEVPERPPSAEQLGFPKNCRVLVENWSEGAHQNALSAARGALDIKGSDFRQRHKPPTKAVDYIVSGIPLAMNPDTSVVDQFARWGFEIASPNDTDRWFSREYWEETQRFGSALAELLSRHRVGIRLKHIIQQTWAEKAPAAVLSQTETRRPSI